MFMSNNRPSFHFWWKENLLKHRKVSIFDDIDCLQNFALIFMILSTTKFVKSVIFRLKFALCPKKNVLKQS